MQAIAGVLQQTNEKSGPRVIENELEKDMNQHNGDGHG